MNEEREQKRFSKTWITVGLVIILFFVYQIPMPYYYSQPGDATGLRDVIHVEGGDQDKGEFFLTTIQQRKANLIVYAWSFLSPYRVLTPEDVVLLNGETEDDYHHRQIQSMRQSQDAAKIAAYRAADADVEVNENGVLVTQFVEGMDAENAFESGDIITAVMNEDINNITELNASLAHKEAGETAELTVDREGEVIEVEVEIMTFSEMEGEAVRNEDGNLTGLGIHYPVNHRDVDFDPEVTIEAGEIGGPSAGLMFSLEIYNQLEEEDITKGLNIAGTGTIDEEGNIGRIGGIAQKIVAADDAGIDVFFTPDDVERPGTSNYEVAVETAEDIGTEMEVVGVGTLEEALSFLEDRS